MAARHERAGHARRGEDDRSRGARCIDGDPARHAGQRLGKLANAVGATSDLKKGRPGRRGGDKLDVAGFVTRRGLHRESGLEQRIGPLKFVPGRSAGVAYLVAEDVTIRTGKQGQARRVTKSGRVAAGRFRAGIVAFVGVKRTRRQRRVEPGAIAARWQLQMSLLMREELGRTR